MCNLMYSGVKCNGVYLQRCFNHLILITSIKKMKISEINIVFCGCLKNNIKKHISRYPDFQKNLYGISGLRTLKL